MKGNVAGCGINFETREVFFTLNGEFLGKEFINKLLAILRY